MSQLHRALQEWNVEYNVQQQSLLSDSHMTRKCMYTVSHKNTHTDLATDFPDLSPADSIYSDH